MRDLAEQLDMHRKARQAAHPEPRTLSAWPKTLPDQFRLLRDLLAAAPAPVTAAELARTFPRLKPAKLEELLKTMVLMGQARETGDGRFGR